jgi:hypothetical protein
MDEEDAQTAALQVYFEDNRPAGYGASFRAGWDAGRDYAARERALREGALRDALVVVELLLQAHYCVVRHDPPLEQSIAVEAALGATRAALAAAPPAAPAQE